jgi:O-antigen/teichoic acid export membrane protein
MDRLYCFDILMVLKMVWDNLLWPFRRLIARQDGKDILQVKTEMRAAFIFGAAAGLAGLGAGPWLIESVFGPRFMEAGYLLGLVMWLPIPFSCGSTIARLYFARGEPFFPVLFSGAGALVMILIMPRCLTAMDTTGAVLATAAGIAVWALSLICLLVRSGDLNLRQTIFRPLALILCSLGVFIALKTLNSWLAMLISWLVLFCGMLQFGGVTEEERGIFKLLKHKWCSLAGPGSNQLGS